MVVVSSMQCCCISLQKNGGRGEEEAGGEAEQGLGNGHRGGVPGARTREAEGALERFDAKQGRQQVRLGLRRGQGRAATENRARRSADGAEEIRSRSGPGRDPDGRLDELMEAATLAPADDRRGGRE